MSRARFAYPWMMCFSVMFTAHVSTSGGFQGLVSPITFSRNDIAGGPHVRHLHSPPLVVAFHALHRYVITDPNGLANALYRVMNSDFAKYYSLNKRSNNYWCSSWFQRDVNIIMCVFFVRITTALYGNEILFLL